MTPTFEWSAVSDDSGVHYRLQIATSANVTATGEFVDPLVSVDIVGTNYTLEKKTLCLMAPTTGLCKPWMAQRTKAAGPRPIPSVPDFAPMGIHCHHSRNSGAPRRPDSYSGNKEKILLLKERQSPSQGKRTGSYELYSLLLFNSPLSPLSLRRFR